MTPEMEREMADSFTYYLEEAPVVIEGRLKRIWASLEVSYVSYVDDYYGRCIEWDVEEIHVERMVDEETDPDWEHQGPAPFVLAYNYRDREANKAWNAIIEEAGLDEAASEHDVNRSSWED